jgi:transposase
MTWLNAQRDRNGDPLRPHLTAELAREHVRLMLVGEQLRELGQAAQEAPVSTAAAEMARRAGVLQRLKGVGPVFAATLTNEVFYKDFHNRREVAGYCGLAPSPWRSGRTNREQGISKAGNPRARHKVIELAWLWLEHQPESALTRWFRERTAQGKGRIKRIAIVALARKLIVALWRFLTTGLVPEQAVLKAAA